MRLVQKSWQPLQFDLQQGQLFTGIICLVAGNRDKGKMLVIQALKAELQSKLRTRGSEKMDKQCREALLWRRWALLQVAKGVDAVLVQQSLGCAAFALLLMMLCCCCVVAVMLLLTEGSESRAILGYVLLGGFEEGRERRGRAQRGQERGRRRVTERRRKTYVEEQFSFLIHHLKTMYTYIQATN